MANYALKELATIVREKPRRFRSKRIVDEQTLTRLIDMALVFITVVGLGVIGAAHASTHCAQLLHRTAAVFENAGPAHPKDFSTPKHTAQARH